MLHGDTGLADNLIRRDHLGIVALDERGQLAHAVFEAALGIAGRRASRPAPPGREREM